MDDGVGLANAEYLILSDLESSPRPLYELGWAEAPSRRVAAEVLGPGLVSLAARSFIEVRRFDRWPARWEEGIPVIGDDLRHASGRAEDWSDDTTHGVLAAHLTEAGISYL